MLHGRKAILRILPERYWLHHNALLGLGVRCPPAQALPKSGPETERGDNRYKSLYSRSQSRHRKSTVLSSALTVSSQTTKLAATVSASCGSSDAAASCCRGAG